MMSNRYTLNGLDAMEILKTENSQHEFPKHFHETYAISLIERGILGENQVIGTQGSILISHPDEVHENKLIDDNAYTFTTLYVNPAVIQYISKGLSIFFPHKIIQDRSLYQQLRRVVDAVTLQEEQGKGIPTQMHDALVALIHTHGLPAEARQEPVPNYLFDIQQYIIQHCHHKIRLEDMALQTKLTKFQLIRQFKKHIGLTPFEYLNLQRVIRAKHLLHQQTPFIQAALESGFYDQSHFNKYFKRYVGLSPMHYLNASNMLQDFPVQSS